MKQHELVQGSEEWHAFRLDHFGASEAAAMLGMSPHATRDELLRAKATGIKPDVSASLQAVFDRGHETEAAALPIANKIVGDELYPVTYSEGKLSASCDGLTMDGMTAFEHKQWNADLAAAVAAGVLPDEHQPQCQQVMMVTGAKVLLFMVSDGTAESCEYMRVYPDAAWRKRITQGWAQFSDDLAGYQHVPTAAEAVAERIDSLPALAVQIQGRVLTTNLDQYSKAAAAFLAGINTDLKTDDDFATAEKTVKFCADAEKKLDLAKEQALSQMVSIDEVFRMIDASENLCAPSAWP